MKSFLAVLVAIAWRLIDIWDGIKRKKHDEEIQELREDPIRWWADNFTAGVPAEPEQADAPAPNSDNDAG